MRKALLGIGILLAISGIILCLCFGGAEMENLWKGEYTMTEASVLQEAEGVSAIDVKCDNFAVFVQTSDSVEKVTVKGIADDRLYTLSVQCADGKLTVRQENKWYWLFALFTQKTRFVQILLPQSLDTSALSVKIEVDAGAVEVSGAHLAALRAGTDAGNVTVTDCAVSGDLTITSSAGKATVKGTSAGSLKTETSAGAIDVDAACLAAELHSDAGSVRFALTADKIRITTDVGSVSGTVRGKQEDYTVTAHTDVGQCNLTNRTAAGDKNLSVTTDVGSIDIHFTNE